MIPMDCPPFLVSWNITKRCNLKCSHCYLDASELEGNNEATTVEAHRFVDEIASVNPQAMLVLTGGEPLMRPDIFEVSCYASQKGLTVVLGTNGTLLEDKLIEKLKDSGVKGVGVSLDSLNPSYHDTFRGQDGAWQKTVKAIDSLRLHEVPFQLQLTATRQNMQEIPSFIEFAYEKNAKAVNIFFLVCTGRGQDITDITPSEYEEILKYLTEAEDAYKGKIMVRARCAPHFLRVASENPLHGSTSGCIAGRGYLRISPEGFVTPCPYIPVNSATYNLKEKPLKDIIETDRQFTSLRKPQYSGRCKGCEFAESCGGCRARALASTGDLMGEDPWCAYEPKGSDAKKIEVNPLWTIEAQERLKNIPSFLRGMVKKGVERYAKHKGIERITPELMAELRKRSGR
ncbi:MAG: radical SAM protein [Deltaproteobacteria bacterium]|nr:radical SAM protein [Deltaproteobacteria bacterium]